MTSLYLRRPPAETWRPLRIERQWPRLTREEILRLWPNAAKETMERVTQVDFMTRGGHGQPAYIVTRTHQDHREFTRDFFEEPKPEFYFDEPDCGMSLEQIIGMGREE